MARITVEDCLQNIPNRFEMVLTATKRARQIANGAEPLVEEENDKPTVIALREIADGIVDPERVDVIQAEIEAAERQAMARIGADHYLEKRIEERVSSGALEEFYEQNYKRFQTPLQYQLRLITVDFAGTDRPYDVFEFL